MVNYVFFQFHVMIQLVFVICNGHLEINVSIWGSCVYCLSEIYSYTTVSSPMSHVPMANLC